MAHDAVANHEGAVTVRSAAFADSSRLADLLTQLGYPVAADEVGERLAYWLPDPMSRVLVADRDGEVVGVIAIHANPYLERTGRWLRIDCLVVGESARGTGVGHELMRAAQDMARIWRCTAMEVTSSRARSAAHAFYVALGFEDVCDRSARFFKLVDEPAEPATAPGG